MDTAFDLVVIGAGNAGLGAAGRAREAGWRVAVIERSDVGGTCPLRGCVPKKVLVAAAETLEVIARAGEHGVSVARASLDWGALMARKESFVRGVPDDFARSLERRGIELIRGAARFVGPDALEVGGRRIAAPRFVVATGSMPRRLGVEGEALAITSDGFLTLPERPARVVLIGGGVISMEFAHVLARAGSSATVLELGPRVLPSLDAALVEDLVRVGESVGVRHITGAATRSIAREGGELVVRAEIDGRVVALRADAVVNAVGRVPALEDLDLPAAGVTLSRGRPAIDATMRSRDNPRVWFAGDALPGTPQLSPVATLEGAALVDGMLDPSAVRGIDYAAIPSCVYTIPPIASVGLSEAGAREAGRDFEVRDNEMSSWRSSRTYAERAARARVVIERGSDRVLGASVLGHGAPEIIHVFALAVAHGMTATALRRTTFAYPTFSSDIRYLL